jgi:CHAT domain-containing protein
MTLGEAVVLAACFVQECNARQPCRALARLGHALLDPVRDLLRDASRLCVVLPNNLGALPLHAVELDGEPLVTHVDVVYIPSVDFMEPRFGGVRSRKREALVLAVPNPRYEVVEPLSWAGQEANAVSRRFESVRLLTDDNATSRTLLQGLRGRSLLHAATHAAFEQQAPLLARLLLADRPVFAFEIALAGAPLDTVNLSGCHTASQLMHLGGEGEGLAAAFLSSGARAVIASWWPVEDAAAGAFNDMFYDELTSSAGTDPWTAANAAQRRMLMERQWSHLALWAPFVVLGAPTQSAS